MVRTIQCPNCLIEFEVDAIPVVRQAEKSSKRAVFVVGAISKTTITGLFLEQWSTDEQGLV